MKVKFYENAEDSILQFAVIIARHAGKWVFCRHKLRDTWEIPGGHREPSESIAETAARELREETGAIAFTIAPLCAYSVTGKTRVNALGEETFGMLYYAEIQSFEKELHSEMESITLLDGFPDKWTYPLIQPFLIQEYLRRRLAGLCPFHTEDNNRDSAVLSRALDDIRGCIAAYDRETPETTL